MVPESVQLVLVSGAIGIAGTLIALVLQRRWAVDDRRRNLDRMALEAAVKKLMAWQDMAVKLLSAGDVGDIASADRRLRELDELWESDWGLIPDQEAVQELVRLSREVYFFSGAYRDDPQHRDAFDRLITLQDRVIASAQKKRRELA